MSWLLGLIGLGIKAGGGGKAMLFFAASGQYFIALGTALWSLGAAVGGLLLTALAFCL